MELEYDFSTFLHGPILHSSKIGWGAGMRDKKWAFSSGKSPQGVNGSLSLFPFLGRIIFMGTNTNGYSYSTLERLHTAFINISRSIENAERRRPCLLKLYPDKISFACKHLIVLCTYAHTPWFYTMHNMVLLNPFVPWPHLGNARGNPFMRRQLTYKLVPT